MSIKLDIHCGTLTPGLYIVGTPIGNLRDISLRALDTLASCDVVFCEDTRVSGKLFKAYGISKPLKVYNDHSDDRQRQQVITSIQEGKSVALISDAGLPLISDPGYKLIGACLEEAIYITSIPGASSTLTALQLSGLPSDTFSFIGFLPSKTKARCDALRAWLNVPSTLIAFESSRRLQNALGDIEQVLGDRHVVVARELTKRFEEIRSGSAQELISYYEEHNAPKGEIVLLIAPPNTPELSDQDIEAALSRALQMMSVKDAAEFVSSQSGRPKKEIYNLALQIKS